VDCGVTFPVAATGPVPTRCPAHRAASYRAADLAKAGRNKIWREANRERLRSYKRAHRDRDNAARRLRHERAEAGDAVSAASDP